MRHLSRVSAFVLIAALAACSSQKAPAEAAVKAARDAYNTVDASDARYAATEAKAVRDSVENAEAALSRAAYPLAIQEATGVPDRVVKLQAAIAARKAELTEKWAKASAAIPPFMAQVTKKLAGGGGLAKPAADKAHASLEAASNAWTEATVAGQSGDIGTAASKADDVKSALVMLANQMKMKVPADLQ